MAEVWRVEYHVIKDGEAIDWMASRTEAIDLATEVGGHVEKVTEYLTDREIIWPPEAEDDE